VYKYQIPACYYPTTVVFIDDNRKFLSALSQRFEHIAKKGFIPIIPKFFSSAEEALKYLQDYQPDLFTVRCLHHDDPSLDHRKIDVNVPAIREEIYIPERFTQISVIVVDYAMPDLNGLELCKKLQNKPFKKLMLTGEADEATAVQAFNEGAIDKFIRKDIPQGFDELLLASIRELQLQYFQDLSTIVIDSITADPEFPNISWLNDPAFLKLFDKLYQENEVAEYYLTDVYGSYLFLDSNAKPSWLAVKDEDGMNGTYEIGRDSDTPFPPEMLEEIKSRKKVLYLYDEGGLTDYPEEAARSLHPATKLQGKIAHYYSFIKDPNAYDINQDEITSFNEYVKKHKTEEP